MGYALPHLYDALYAFKDYAVEAEPLTRLIRQSWSSAPPRSSCGRSSGPGSRASTSPQA